MVCGLIVFLADELFVSKDWCLSRQVCHIYFLRSYSGEPDVYLLCPTMDNPLCAVTTKAHSPIVDNIANKAGVSNISKPCGMRDSQTYGAIS